MGTEPKLGGTGVIEDRVFMELSKAEEIPMRLRIEVFAMVALGLRPLGLIFLPAELPDGSSIGKAIDQKYQDDLREGVSGSLVQRLKFTLLAPGKPPVVKKKLLLKQAYISMVQDLPAYKALHTWANKLGLGTCAYEVRPSIHELLIYQTSQVRTTLDELMEERLRIKQEAWARATPYTPYALLTYPEEQVPEYLEKLGLLLGYPQCCIKAYLEDRTNDVNVENRAAADLQSQVETQVVDAWAYFVKDFFPCQPTCTAAAAAGKKTYGALEKVSPALAEAYLALLKENQDRILSYPVVIAGRLKDLEKEQ
jgi:hypothetical protein